MTTVDESWRRGPGLLASVWRHKYMVVLVTLLAGAITYPLVASAEPTYEASARLFLTDPRAGGVFDRAGTVDADRYVPQQAERVTSTPVLERATELLDDDMSVEALSRRVDAEGDVTLNMITITSTAGSGERAAELANAASEAYQDVAREVRLSAAQRAVDELVQAESELDQQIQDLRAESGPGEPDPLVQQQLDVLVAQRIDVSSRAQELLVDARVFGSGVDVVEEATPSGDPVAPRPRRMTALAALVAAAAAAGIAYWRAGTRRHVESREVPGELLDLPLLGTLPVVGRRRISGLDDWIALDPAAQEAYQFLLTSLEYAMQTVDARSVLVTSATPGDGKTETCLQLAVGAVVDGQRTLLVDGDLRMRALTIATGLEEHRGLVDLVDDESGSGMYRTAIHRAPIFGGERLLPILPSGTFAAEGSGSIRHPAVARGLSDLTFDHDLVIIDSAPLLATADTTVLASHVDAVILVVREGASIADLEQVRERLTFVSCPVIGYAYITSDSPALTDYGYTSDRAARSSRIRGGSTGRASASPWTAADSTGEGTGWRPDRPKDVAAVRRRRRGHDEVESSSGPTS